MLLSVPFKKLLLVNSKVLHEFFVFDLFAALMVTLDLVLKFLDTIALISIFLEFFTSEVVAIEELLLEQTDRVIIIFKSL